MGHQVRRSGGGDHGHPAVSAGDVAVNHALARALTQLAVACGADAVVAWQQPAAPARPFVLQAHPAALLPPGAPWPVMGMPGTPRIETDPRRLGCLMPCSLRLALPHPPQAAWSECLGDQRHLLVVWCGRLPTEQTLEALRNFRGAELTLQLEACERQLRAGLEAQRLGAVVASLEQGVVTIDLTRGVASVNPAAARWLGVESGELPVAELARAMDVLDERALNQDAIAAFGKRLVSDPQGPSEALVWRLPQPPTHLRVTSSPLQVAGTRGRIWVFDDLSPLLEAQEMRERALQAQAESDQRFRLAMDNAAVGMALVSRDGRFLEVNDALCRFFAADAAALVATTWQALTHPDDLQAGLALATEVLSGLRDRYRIRKRYRRLDGRVVWGDVSVACLRDEHGNFRCFIEQIVDITEMVETRERLATQEQQFRLLAEHTSEIVLLYNPDLTLAWVSPSLESVLGYDPAALIGRSTQLVVEDDRNQFLSAIEQARQSQATAFTMTLRLRDSQGELHWYDIIVNLVWDHSGELQHLISTLHHVDELVEARQQHQRTAELLQAQSDGMIDPQILIEAIRDKGGRVVDFVYRNVNRAACAYLGLSREELLGSRLLASFPGLQDSELFQAYRVTLDTGQPLALENVLYENEILGVQRHYDVRGSRVGDGLSVSWRDVSDRYEEARRIAESEQRYRLLIDNSSDVVLQISEGVMRWVSPNITSMLGWQPADWLGRSYLQFLHADDTPLAQQAYADISKGSTKVVRLRVADVQGVWRWVEVHGGPYRDGEGHQIGIACSFRTVDAEVAIEAELDRRARTDELTGLINRKEVFARLETLLASSDRRRGQTAVLFIDIDKFKDINDRYGHAAGDRALCTMAGRLCQHTRRGDLIARIGGDEFLVVLTKVSSLEDAVLVAETIRQAGRLPFEADGRQLNSSFSIGVTLAAMGESIDAMVARADEAMYRAKLTGRDLVMPIPVPGAPERE